MKSFSVNGGDAVEGGFLPTLQHYSYYFTFQFMKDCSLNRFDGITYINLDSRPDRRGKVERELEKLSLPREKIHRIEAHFDELNGTRGCILSHLDALSLALEEGWKNVIILEDDCRFIDDLGKINAYIDGFFDHFGENWDVFFLGTDVVLPDKTAHPDYLRVIFSMLAHSYVVNGPYIEKLWDHYAEAYRSMTSDIFYRTTLKKALDREWVDLQCADRWYAGVDMITRQEACFSDIEKKPKRQR